MAILYIHVAEILKQRCRCKEQTVACSLRIHTSDFLTTSSQKHRLSYESATGSTRGLWKVIQTLLVLAPGL